MFERCSEKHYQEGIIDFDVFKAELKELSEDLYKRVSKPGYLDGHFGCVSKSEREAALAKRALSFFANKSDLSDKLESDEQFQEIKTFVSQANDHMDEAQLKRLDEIQTLIEQIENATDPTIQAKLLKTVKAMYSRLASADDGWLKRMYERFNINGRIDAWYDKHKDNAIVRATASRLTGGGERESHALRKKWRSDPTVNPRTGRHIQHNGPTFRALVKELGSPL